MRKMLIVLTALLFLESQVGVSGHNAKSFNVVSSSTYYCDVNNGTTDYTYMLATITQSCSGTNECTNGEATVSVGENSWTTCGQAAVTAYCSGCDPSTDSNCSCGTGCKTYCQCSLGNNGNQRLYFTASGAYAVITYDIFETSSWTNTNATVNVQIQYDGKNFNASLVGDVPAGAAISPPSAPASTGPKFVVTYNPS